MATTEPQNVARTYVPTGSVWDIARNRDITTGVGKLISQDLSITTDRPGVWRQWEMVAGWPVDHGEVADQAAMLALHTFDGSATAHLLPRCVAPGDSCTRADDPGWRWHCLSGHGLTLADWERRPLSGALDGLAVTGHTHPQSAITGLPETLAGKQASLTNAAALAPIGMAGGLPTWDGAAWPGSGGAATSDSLITAANPVAWYQSDAGVESASGVPAVDTDAAMYWRDRSGNGYDLEQATSGYRPALRTGQLGGLPVLRLDGTDDHMLAATFPSIDLGNCTVIIVGQVTSTAEYGRVMVIGASGAGYDYNSPARLAIETGTSAQTMRISAGTSTELVVPLALGRPAPAAVYAIRSYRRRVQLGMDDVVSAAAVSSTLTTSVTGLLLGAHYASGVSLAYCLAGDISEIAILPVGLGDSQLGAIVAALRSKYAL